MKRHLVSAYLAGSVLAAACAGAIPTATPTAVPGTPAPIDSEPAPTASINPPTITPWGPAAEVTTYKDLAYGPALPGNLLDLYVPEAQTLSGVPLVIWHTGSGWGSNDIKKVGDEVVIVEEFTKRGYAVASLNVRSSDEARFPAQGFDVRAAIRYLHENAAIYGLDDDRFAFMGNSSGGWASAFAATTSDDPELDGETGVDGTSSAVKVAVAFFPATDFLSIDEFAGANSLPMSDFYPFDSPGSIVGLLVQCPGEGPAIGTPAKDALVSIQECPTETEQVDPASYVDGAEIPMWLLHGLADEVLPYNQSQLLYVTTTAAGNEARLTLVARASHSVREIVDARESTTWLTGAYGVETETSGPGPSWDEIEQFIATHL